MRILEGFIQCPVAVLIVVDALQQRYPARIAGHQVVITLPPIDMNAMNVERPPLAEPEWHFRGIRLPANEVASASSDGPLWGEVTHRAGDGGVPTAAQVKRLRTVVEVDTDDAGVRMLAEDIARGAPVWWRSVAAWIEVLYQQDLSRLGPASPGWHFNGTAFWTQLDGDGDKNQVTFVAAQPGRYVMLPYSPLTADKLRQCMRSAEDHGMPSAAWLFLRDARSMYLGYDHRRAAIDAGTAAEVGVTQMIATHLARKGLDDAEVDQKLERRTLGQLCRYWLDECGGTLPDRYRERLVHVRNDAIHTKRSISRAQSEDAIVVAAEIVAAADSPDLRPPVAE
ncbi:hypothetical protein [Mycolicibacterium aromaticivorans]|uniref:hypothetical protein n=1 Tax=Mycolicibacterium aromaticivorans TaxID=318425 RepID=UPI0010394F0A|nr:hypothetical protein [Mycolicibacterium aromaticivorans]